MDEITKVNEVMFTSASVLDLLLQIDELKEYTISLTETLDKNIQLQIGDSVYLIENDNAKTVNVDGEVVEEIESTTEDAYTEIEDYIDVIDETFRDIDEFEPVNAGIIKEVAKSLLLGGMIRFAGKHLLK